MNLVSVLIVCSLLLSGVTCQCSTGTISSSQVLECDDATADLTHCKLKFIVAFATPMVAGACATLTAFNVLMPDNSSASTQSLTLTMSIDRSDAQLNVVNQYFAKNTKQNLDNRQFCCYGDIPMLCPTRPQCVMGWPYAQFNIDPVDCNVVRCTLQKGIAQTCLNDEPYGDESLTGIYSGVTPSYTISLSANEMSGRYRAKKTWTFGTNGGDVLFNGSKFEIGFRQVGVFAFQSPTIPGSSRVLDWAGNLHVLGDWNDLNGWDTNKRGWYRRVVGQSAYNWDPNIYKNQNYMYIKSCCETCQDWGDIMGYVRATTNFDYAITDTTLMAQYLNGYTLTSWTKGESGFNITLKNANPYNGFFTITLQADSIAVYKLSGYFVIDTIEMFTVGICSEVQRIVNICGTVWTAGDVSWTVNDKIVGTGQVSSASGCYQLPFDQVGNDTVRICAVGKYSSCKDFVPTCKDRSDNQQPRAEDPASIGGSDGPVASSDGLAWWEWLLIALAIALVVGGGLTILFCCVCPCCPCYGKCKAKKRLKVETVALVSNPASSGKQMDSMDK